MKLFLSLFFAFLAPLAAEEPVAVYLTWQRDPSTTMTIQWISSDKDVGNEVVVGPSSNGPTTRVLANEEPFPQGAPYLIHRVELTNLEPDTEYTFTLPGTSEAFRFATLPSTWTRPIRFAVGGDVYHDSAPYVIRMNKVVASRSPDFAILGGDLAYAAGKYTFFAQDTQRWITFLRIFSDTLRTPDGRLIPWVAILGNHDVTGRYDQLPEHAAVYYALFPLPGYQALDWGDNLSLVFLDSGHTHPIPGEQTDWLRQTLSDRQHVTHRFAFYHVPAFPSVRNFFNKRSVPIRQYWVPLFEEFGLNAAFEHHDHSYKRTHPLLHGRIDPSGVVYIGDGAWGVKDPRKPYSPRKLPILANSKQSQNVTLITIDQNSRRFEAINEKNEVFDRYEQTVEAYQTVPLLQK